MEIEEILKSLFALLLVLSLIGASAFILKRYVLERNFLNLSSGSNSKKRLKIVEQIFLDSKRRMLIVEKDGNEEITLILGAGSETIVSVSAKKKR